MSLIRYTDLTKFIRRGRRELGGSGGVGLAQVSEDCMLLRISKDFLHESYLLVLA